MPVGGNMRYFMKACAAVICVCGLLLGTSSHLIGEAEERECYFGADCGQNIHRVIDENCVDARLEVVGESRSSSGSEPKKKKFRGTRVRSVGPSEDRIFEYTLEDATIEQYIINGTYAERVPVKTSRDLKRVEVEVSRKYVDLITYRFDAKRLRRVREYEIPFDLPFFSSNPSRVSAISLECRGGCATSRIKTHCSDQYQIKPRRGYTDRQARLFHTQGDWPGQLVKRPPPEERCVETANPEDEIWLVCRNADQVLRELRP